MGKTVYAFLFPTDLLDAIDRALVGEFGDVEHRDRSRFSMRDTRLDEYVVLACRDAIRNEKTIEELRAIHNPSSGAVIVPRSLSDLHTQTSSRKVTP